MDLFENDSVFDVANNVVRDKDPFILKGTTKINDNDPTSVNTFFKDITALNDWIEKKKDKYDETLNITFTGELIKYTETFTKIQRSDNGTGCDSFKKIIEYRGDLCYIPEENECFRNVWNIYLTKTYLQNIVILSKNLKEIKA